MAEMFSLIAMALAALALWWTHEPDKTNPAPQKHVNTVDVSVGNHIKHAKGLKAATVI